VVRRYDHRIKELWLAFSLQRDHASYKRVINAFSGDTYQGDDQPLKAKRTILFFLLLSALIPPVYSAEYGEDEDYLGQVVDDYENAANIAAMTNTIHNETLDCMELLWSSVEGMIIENFTLYDEVDPNSRISRTSSTKIVVNGLKRGDGDSYVREDYGAGYFGLDFTYYWVFNVTSAEAGDADSRTWLRLWAVTTAGLPTDAGARILLNLDQVGADDTLFTLELYIRNGVGSVDNDVSINLNVGTQYFMKLDRDGDDVNCEIRTGSLEGTLIDTLLASVVDYDDTFRYIYFPMRKNSVADVDDWISGDFEHLWNGSYIGGYASSGSYYTFNVLDDDPAIAILYNLTIPDDCGATMEFSTDNVTWVDHNNEAGSDTLIAGYEALDLRDIYNGTTYRRVNMTSDGSDTPRMWQERFVTVTTIIPSEGGGLFPGLAIGISLLIVGAVYALEKRR